MNSTLAATRWRAGTLAKRSVTGQGTLKTGARGISNRELDSRKAGRERVVVLGSGWAGYNMARLLDPAKYQVVVVSPRSYFVFTPLLASTAVGTLEFRTTLEPVRKQHSEIQYYQGWADDVNFNKKTLRIEESVLDQRQSMALTGGPEGVQDVTVKKKGHVFDIGYDKLVVSVGCYSQTFGTKGVKENAFFLKDVGDARKIRKRILDCFETAALPTTSEAKRRELLSFAIVGGGPTGCEFAAELHDLCHEDLRKLYPELIRYVRITIYDVAERILSMFDTSLAKYATDKYRRDDIKVKTQHHIEELRPGLPDITEGFDVGVGGFTLRTKEDGDVGIGMCVWSTGLKMNPFIKRVLSDVHTYPSASAQLPESSTISSPSDLKWSIKRHPKNGGLVVDDQFHVKLITEGSENAKPVEATMKDVFALGDVAVLESGALPATAQVANQESKWLATRFNKGDVEEKKFTFKSLGVMTYIGNWRAIMQGDKGTEIRGWVAWVVWRGAYLTQTISWRNKLLIPIYWAVNWIFGRDISRF